MFSAQKLKQRRKELALSQADLAKELGIARPSYFNWENGKTVPNKKNRIHLAQILSVTPHYFLSEYEIVESYVQLSSQNQKKALNYSKELLDKQSDSTNQQTLYTYKVFEKLSAGSGFAYFGDGNFDTVFFDEKIDHEFASWIFGESMEPTFLNGEVALIKQSNFDYDGAIYAVEWDGQTYIKKVYREDNGLRLVSINKRYADKFAPYDEDPRIIGQIVGNFMPLER